jgi:hypothetical protein
MDRDRELFEETIRFVSWSFGTATWNAGFDKVLDVGVDGWPGELTLDEFKCFVLTKVASSGVVMLILKNVKVKISAGGSVVGYEDVVMVEEESRFGKGPVWVFFAGFKVVDVLLSSRVGLETLKNVDVEVFKVDEGGCTECWK